MKISLFPKGIMQLFLLPVVPDVLDVVVILEHIEHLLHILYIVLIGELDISVLGQHLDLSGKQLIAGSTYLLGNGRYIVGLGVDDKGFAVRLKIVRSGVKHFHHDGILVKLLVLVVNDNNSLLVEGPGNAAGSAQVAAELVEVVMHGACGTVAVVGHGLHDDSNAAGVSFRRRKQV